MTNGAEITGIDEVLRNMEKQLGTNKVNRTVNKSLREVGRMIEPDFKEAIGVFKDTGETIDSVTVSGVRRSEGIPGIKIGFGAGSRWRLVHLNEFGYAKQRNPRGLGVIRRFSDELEGVYPKIIKEKLKIEGFK